MIGMVWMMEGRVEDGSQSSLRPAFRGLSPPASDPVRPSQTFEILKIARIGKNGPAKPPRRNDAVGGGDSLSPQSSPSHVSVLTRIFHGEISKTMANQCSAGCQTGRPWLFKGQSERPVHLHFMGSLCLSPKCHEISRLKPGPRQPAVNPHPTVMPKPVRNPFKLLAPWRLCAFASKFHRMVAARTNTHECMREKFRAMVALRKDLMRIQTSCSLMTVFRGFKVIQGCSRLNFFPPPSGRVFDAMINGPSARFVGLHPVPLMFRITFRK